MKLALFHICLLISYLPYIILITVTPHYFVIIYYYPPPPPSTAAAPEEGTLELSVVSPVSGKLTLGILLLLAS